MKNTKSFFLLFFLLGILILPFKVLAANTYICDGNCASAVCVAYSSPAEAANKCVAPDGVPADACKAKIGTCPEAAVTPTTSAPSTPVDNTKFVTKLENPLVGVHGVTDILGNVIRVAMSVMGAAVLVMVVKGATTWITAGGNSEAIESGTKTIIWAIIGAVLTVASYLVLHSIIDAFFHPLAQ